MSTSPLALVGLATRPLSSGSFTRNVLGVVTCTLFIATGCEGGNTTQRSGDPEQAFLADTAGLGGPWGSKGNAQNRLQDGYGICNSLDEGASINDVELVYNMAGMTEEYASRIIVRSAIDNLCPEYQELDGYDALTVRD